MASPLPVKLKLRRSSRVLEVSFDDGARFEFPCGHLRLSSPSAATGVTQGRGEPVGIREDVTIERIEPVGSDAVRLHFNDGHDPAVYSWETLYRLGRERGRN